MLPGTKDKILVWTRSEADWSEDELLLGAVSAQIAIVRMPCIRVMPIPAQPAAACYKHLICTSINAARRLVTDPRLQPLGPRAQTIHTHGAATANYLAAQGLPVALYRQARTARSLANFVAAVVKPGEPIGWLTAQAPSFDFVQDFAQRGIELEVIVCYETVLTKSGHEAALAAMEKALTGILCFASPSAVRAFNDYVRQNSKNLPMRLHHDFSAVVIGPTTAQAAQGHFAKVLTARDNSLTALIETARSLI